MTKERISATISPERLATAKSLLDSTNVSAVLDEALSALIERESEASWLAVHPTSPDGRDDLPGEVTPDLSALPWDG